MICCLHRSLSAQLAFINDSSHTGSLRLASEHVAYVVEDHPEEDVGQNGCRGEDVLQEHLVPAGSEQQRWSGIRTGCMIYCMRHSTMWHTKQGSTNNISVAVVWSQLLQAWYDCWSWDMWVMGSIALHIWHSSAGNLCTAACDAWSRTQLLQLCKPSCVRTCRSPPPGLNITER